MRAARVAALLAFALPVLAPVAARAAGSEPVIQYQHESFSAFEKQLAAGQISSAEFNKKPHSLHLLLKSGAHDLVIYPPTEEPQIAAKLEAKGVPVSIEKSHKKAKAATHHTLRYIAGGIVVLVIVVVTAVLLVDRRRKLAGTGGPAAEAGGPAPGGPPPGGPAQ
jgi:ATP-dependent Zn protease